MKSTAVFVLMVLTVCCGQAQTTPKVPQLPDVEMPPDLMKLKQTAPPLAGPIGVEDAVGMALQLQMNLRISESNAISADAIRRQLAGLGRPQIGVTATHSRTSVIAGSPGANTQAGWNDTATATFTQLLLDFGRLGDQVAQQELIAQAAQLTVAAAKSDTALSVRSAYYAFAASKKLVDNAEANFRSRADQRNLAKARVQAGVGSPGDLVQAQTALSEAALQVSASRYTLNSSRIALCLAIGIDPRTPIELKADGSAPAPVDLEGLVATAMDGRPEIRRAQSLVEAAKAGVAFASRSNFPTLNLNASYTGRGQETLSTNRSASLGLSLSWALFDSGITAAKVVQAKALLDIAQDGLNLARQQVIAEIDQAFATLATAQQRLAISRDQVSMAKELLRINAGRYQGGISTFLDVVTAQDSVNNAQRTLVLAEADYQIAWAAARHALGQG